MKKLLLLLLCASGFYGSYAQERQIKGKITDEDNNPLSGATIMLKGTSVSTSSSGDGSFQIDIGNRKNAVLLISFVGYLQQEYPVRGRSDISIRLDRDASSLGDVVVVGYGVQKKSDITGASSTITAKEISKRPLVRLEQALQGTTSGVYVISPNGQPGQGLRVKIRGSNSITGSTEPLYVIDGDFQAGLKAYKAGSFDEAGKYFQQADKVYPAHAACNYYLGRLECLHGNFKEAEAFFSRARDLDALRFRAPHQFNEVIARLCGKYKNTCLVDTWSVFEAWSDHHIIGDELILEHVHPNLLGYALLSEAFYEAIKKKGLISIAPDKEIPLKRLLQLMPITTMDSLTGAIKTNKLKKSWPFSET